MNIVKEILFALMVSGICVIVAYLLRSQKQNILITLTNLIQTAENTVKGSGMGAEKKALVLAQLEASGIKIKTWMSIAIDNIVKTLNEQSAWFIKQVDAKTKG